MIKTEKFRSDLFYRLNVLPICLPPLRKRTDDIEALISYMIDKFNDRHGRNLEKASFGALSALKAYSWPGNIRELENVIEHAFIMEQGNQISINSLPDHIKSVIGGAEHMPQAEQKLEGATAADNHLANTGASLETEQAGMIRFDGENLNFPELKEQFEKEFLISALRTFGGKINRTAEKN